MPVSCTSRQKGKRNEPSYLNEIAATVANLKAISIESLAKITASNARYLFKMGVSKGGKIAYKIRNSMYINLTNRCTNMCVFCPRAICQDGELIVKGHNLRIDREPTSEEVLSAVGDPTNYDEIVFCGYGEPLIRLTTLIEVSKELKKKGARIRVDTNGHGNLIHRRNIVPELAKVADAISISLNESGAKKYFELCKPQFGESTYDHIKEFAVECRKHIPKVTVSVVGLPSVNTKECGEIAESLGAEYRVREHDKLGN